MAEDNKLNIISKAIFIRSKVYDTKANEMVDGKCVGDEREAKKKLKGTKEGMV